jgi:hypothetical protein
MYGPGKRKAVANLKERLSLIWFVKELARRLPKLRYILPGGPRLHPSKRVLAAPGQINWIGKRSSQYFRERGNIAAGKDEIRIHGSYEVGGGANTVTSDNGTSAARGFVYDDRKGFVLRG